MAPRTVLITGANRGLGLEFVKQYAAEGYEVLAVVRGEPSEALRTTNAKVYRCDLGNPNAIAKLKEEVGTQPLDLVINNAGVYPKGSSAVSMTDAQSDEFLAAMKVNVISPLRLAGAFAENLRAKPDGLKKIAFLTSKMGSISDNASGGHYGYRATKAALNAVAVSLSKEIPDITVLILHPGWVRTDMGGSNGLIEADESVRGLRQVISTTTKTGTFIDYKGAEINW